MLGGTPVIGRGFRPDEFEPGKDFVVILGHGFWQRAYGGRGDVLNSSITLNGQPYTIVGVMHPNWRFGGRDIALFTPRAFDGDERQARGGHYLNVDRPPETRRLDRSGQPSSSARIASRLEQQYPATNKGWGVVVALAARSRGRQRPADAADAPRRRRTGAARRLRESREHAPRARDRPRARNGHPHRHRRRPRPHRAAAADRKPGARRASAAASACSSRTGPRRRSSRPIPRFCRARPTSAWTATCWRSRSVCRIVTADSLRARAGDLGRAHESHRVAEGERAAAVRGRCGAGCAARSS